MCHGGAEYLSGEYRGEPEIESEVFKPHSEDCEIIGFVYPILLQGQPHGYPLQQRENIFVQNQVVGSGYPPFSERA